MSNENHLLNHLVSKVKTIGQLIEGDTAQISSLQQKINHACNEIAALNNALESLRNQDAAVNKRLEEAKHKRDKRLFCLEKIISFRTSFTIDKVEEELKKLAKCLLLATAGQEQIDPNCRRLNEQQIAALYHSEKSKLSSLKQQLQASEEKLETAKKALGNNVTISCSGVNEKGLTHEIEQLEKYISTQISQLQSTENLITQKEHALSQITEKKHSLEQKISIANEARNQNISALTTAFLPVKHLYFSQSKEGKKINTQFEALIATDPNESAFPQKVNTAINNLQSYVADVNDAQGDLTKAINELQSANNSMNQNISNFLNAPEYSTVYAKLEAAIAFKDKYPKPTYTKITHYISVTSCCNTECICHVNDTHKIVVHDTAKYEQGKQDYSDAQTALNTTENQIVAAAEPLLNNTLSFDQFDQVFNQYQFSLPFCPATTTFTDYYLNTVKPSIENVQIPSVTPSKDSLFGTDISSKPYGYTAVYTFANSYKDWSSQEISSQLGQLITYFNDIWTSPDCK